MARFWNRWIGIPHTTKRGSRNLNTIRRHLKAEMLEDRRLLAADTLNDDLLTQDVNEIGFVSAIDRLNVNTDSAVVEN